MAVITLIGAQTDGVDLWGDIIVNNPPDNGNNGQITWEPQYVQLGSGWEFTRAGRYDYAGSYPSEPSNQVGSDAIYPVANLGYDVVVPEPTILTLVGLGAAAFLYQRVGEAGRLFSPSNRHFAWRFFFGLDQAPPDPLAWMDWLRSGREVCNLGLGFAVMKWREKHEGFKGQRIVGGATHHPFPSAQ